MKKRAAIILLTIMLSGCGKATPAQQDTPEFFANMTESMEISTPQDTLPDSKDLDTASAESFSGNHPFHFNCNRPFFYYITDTLNDDIAFIGVKTTAN